MDKDEPEEGEIQDDDGLLEDVSSDEDTLPICCGKSNETSCDKKYPISGTVETDFVNYSSRVHKRRDRRACKRKSESFSSTAEGSKARLNVKYGEETNKTSNDVYHVTLNSVVVDDHRTDDNFVNMTSEYKSIRPKQSDKDEDTLQEKENRHDCQKESKIKRKCRRKRRHSDGRIDSDVGNQKVCPGHEGKKEDTFTKSKGCHSKKRHVSPKREKHRYSKKKGGRKYWSRRLSDAVQKGSCTGNGVEGNSLLKRLQPMMTGNVSVTKEKTAVEIVKRKDEVSVESQKLECGLKENPVPPPVAVKSDNGNNKGGSETADILKEANKNHLSPQMSEDVVLIDIKKLEPIVITIEDSDSEPQVSVGALEEESGDKVNKEGEVKVIEGETSVVETDEDEDLAQLRLLALQSHRRKVTSKPGVEDDEVMQLRLAALKSAILKKCEVRKQRGVTLKSKKVDTMNSPPLPVLESSSTRDELGQETQKPEIISVKALQSEPDETTTLVDMELSHTDDESSAQNEIITDPISADTCLPGDNAGTFLRVMHEDYSIQSVPCNNEPLLTVHEYKSVNCKQSQKEQDAVSTWNTASSVYRSPELPSFDLEGCQLSGIYGSNVHTPQVGCSNCQLPFVPSSFPPQLHNELYESNSVSNLGRGDLEGVCSDPIISPFDSTVSPAVSRSFVSSDLNCQAVISDTVLGSRVEPELMSANSSVPITESNSLKTESVTSKIGIPVSKAGSVAATDSHLFTLRTETEPQNTDSCVYTQLCEMDSTTVSCQNWDRNMKRHASSRNSVPFENSSFAAAVKTVGITDGPSTISSAAAESFSRSLNCQDQELRTTEVGIVYQNHNVFVPTGDIVEDKSDCNVEESSSEFENIDLSNMIVLDEVGRCSSPEAKIEEVSNEHVMSINKGTSQHHDQSSVSVDEDEEILRARVLTTLVRKPSTSAAYLVNKPNGTKDNKIPVPCGVSSMQHIKTSTNLLSVVPQPTLPSCNLQAVHPTPVSHEKEGTPSKLTRPFDKLKGSSKIALRLPSNKLELSRQNLRNYIEVNAIREKCWKKSVKKGFLGMNIKQSSGHIKQLKEPAAFVINDAQSSAAELKSSCLHCKAVGNPVPRVVFRPRAPRPATLQVTVPTDNVRDEEHRRNIAGSLVSSAASVLPQPPQRFVIHLGEDSDSPDEDGRTQQQPSEAPKRRCIITKNFSVPLLIQPTSGDSIMHSSSNVSSLLPQRPLPVSDKQNSTSVSTQPIPNSGIPVDFEKSLDIFLKEARKSQGATSKKAMTPGRYVGGKANPVASSITPLAVRHLPSSRQEEYHRLKKQIAVLEEQRKRSRQQHLSKNMSSTKSASLPLSPGQDVSASGSVKPSLKIVLTTTSAEKREVLQNSVTSANLGNDGSVKMVMQQYPASHVQVFEDVKASDRDSLSSVAYGVAQTALNERSSHSFLADAVQVKATQNDTGTTDTAVSLTLVSRKHQERTVMETSNLDSVMRKEEEPVINSQEPSPVKDNPHNVCDVHKQSSCKCDCLSSEGSNCEEALEQKEAKLAEVEHQLLSKRYEVVDDLTSMATLLHQIERERTAEEECLSELRRTQEALRRIEERLAQQKELLSNMRNDIAESHRRVAQGRAECISLSKNCQSLGISVKGRLYKVPAGGAELMNLKLQQVAAQTRRLSRRKECSEDGDGSPPGSDVTALSCLQTQGQDKAEIRTACSVVEGSNDTLISYNVCASPTMAENAESDVIPIPCTEGADALVSKTDISQSKKTSSSQILGFSLSQQSFVTSTPLSFSAENVAASKSDRCVQVSKDSETETWTDQDSVPAVTDVKQTIMAVSKDLEMMELGVDGSSEGTVVEHVAEYRSPLEHFHSKRGDSEAGEGVSGPLDPLAILCPYELMGSCQDEECSYQHHTKTTAS